MRKATDAHPQQTDAPLQRHPLEALARDAADDARVVRRRIDGLVAGDDAEVVVAKLEPDGPADVALALQISGQLDAKLGENLRQRGAIAHRVQVAIEGRFA